MVKNQLHILNAANAEDRAQVDQIIVSTAERFAMLDNSVTSRVPETIRHYVEEYGRGFCVGARVVGGLIIVDFKDAKEPSPRFAELEQQITSELHRVFAARVYVPKESELIQPQNSLPLSEASQEFSRKHSRFGKSGLNPL